MSSHPNRQATHTTISPKSNHKKGYIEGQSNFPLTPPPTLKRPRVAAFNQLHQLQRPFYRPIPIQQADMSLLNVCCKPGLFTRAHHEHIDNASITSILWYALMQSKLLLWKHRIMAGATLAAVSVLAWKEPGILDVLLNGFLNGGLSFMALLAQSEGADLGGAAGAGQSRSAWITQLARRVEGIPPWATKLSIFVWRCLDNWPEIALWCMGELASSRLTLYGLEEKPVSFDADASKATTVSIGKSNTKKKKNWSVLAIAAQHILNILAIFYCVAKVKPIDHQEDESVVSSAKSMLFGRADEEEEGRKNGKSWLITLIRANNLSKQCLMVMGLYRLVMQLARSYDARQWRILEQQAIRRDEQRDSIIERIIEADKPVRTEKHEKADKHEKPVKAEKQDKND